jgi:hypothetical protein
VFDQGHALTEELHKDVDGIVLGHGFVHPDKGEQGRHPPVLGHAGDGGRPGGAGIAGQRLEPARGDGRQIQAVHADGAECLHAVEAVQQSGRAEAGRGVAQLVEGGRARSLRDDHELLQPLALRR